jgi:hypothetical protein
MATKRILLELDTYKRPQKVKRGGVSDEYWGAAEAAAKLA